ncbi:MAG TPA: DUF853 family protein [Sandaracinaceae bacterium LLY-WYZ-13_1]|nr:DUF853 family protein [Sandaracinaceae bacterium LLY-WYZ-13_1]
MSDERALWLGRVEGDGRRLELPADALLRHAMALGASGSGKTVFCKVVVEEAVRHGLPAIVVDPQGDLCSLAAGTLDDAELEAHGVDPALAAELRERAEVVVFTPGSTQGVPLCADPVDPGLASLVGAARTQAVSRTASVVVGLLGFDLDSDDGAGLGAVIDRALHELLEGDARPTLAVLTEHLFAAEREGFSAYTRYLDAKKIKLAGQRLARLDVGARRLLFHGGVPIDVDVLLGRDPRAPVAEGRTRVAVVYLNTLHQQEDKDFLLAALVDRLYSWMLTHPSAEPQALFYVDEVAPFVPPVRKPACKEGLSLLFKQARKYGLCCLMATQNPGDVDYRAMAQFGTWALGRLTTRQDLKKIEPTVKSLAPDACDAILGKLPALKPGEMVLLSPDRLEAPVELRTRWLATRHETWGEERIAEHADGLRERFAALTDAVGEANGEEAADEGAPSSSEPSPPSEPSSSEPSSSEPSSSEPSSSEPPPSESLRGSGDSVPGGRPQAGALRAGSDPPDAGRAEPSPSSSADRAPGPAARAAVSSGDGPAPVTEAPEPGGDELVRSALLERESATAQELVAATGRGEGAVRRALKRLADAGEARAFRDGRSKRHWAVATGGRPDLGMPNPVEVLVAHVTERSAEAIANGHARNRVLGLIGESERFERAERVHRLVYQLDFEERVERPVLSRLFGPSHDERLGSVYLHPHNLGVLLFTNEDGIRFTDVPRGPASEIRDFDGVTEREARAPAELAFDEADWTARASEEAVRESFAKRFEAAPGRVAPLFVPLFHLLFRSETGSLRRITIDAILGKPVRWLPPDAGR